MVMCVSALLALRCASLRVLVARRPGRGLCNHRAHEQVLIGRREDGAWRTATKRAYPSPFCSLLANALLCEPLDRYAADAEGPTLPEECSVFQVPLAAGRGGDDSRDLDVAALQAGGVLGGIARRLDIMGHN